MDWSRHFVRTGRSFMLSRRSSSWVCEGHHHLDALDVIRSAAARSTDAHRATGRGGVTYARRHSRGRMESDLSLEFLRVVEQAAIACAHTMGQGDRHKSDQVAVEAMRAVMDTVPIDGTIVIGEGERDEAPMLYIGARSAELTPELPSHTDSV